jgi:hypothetical protein
MNRSNLLFECHNEDCFSGVLPFLAAAYRSHFDHQVHFVNLVDLLSIAENLDKQFQLELKLTGESLAFTFPVEMSGSMPVYLECCNELNAAWNTIGNFASDFHEEVPLLACRFQERTRILFAESYENDYQFEMTRCR